MTISPIRREAQKLLDTRFNTYGWGHGPSDVDRAVRAIESEHQLPGLASARTALRLIVFNEAHVEHLRSYDPMALRQMVTALPEFEGMPLERIAKVAGDEGFEPAPDIEAYYAEPVR